MMKTTHIKIYCPSTNSADKQSKVDSFFTTKKDKDKPNTLMNFYPLKFGKKPRDLNTEFINFQQRNLLYKKIKDIRSKQAKPKLNILFIETEKQLLDYRQRVRDIAKRMVSAENQKYRNRILSKKSEFCRDPLFGKEFEKAHEQLLTKVIQKEMPKLPKIKKKVILKCDTEVKIDNSVLENSEESFDLNQQTQGKKQKRGGNYEYNKSQQDSKDKKKNNESIIKIKCDELNQSSQSKSDENNKNDDGDEKK